MLLNMAARSSHALRLFTFLLVLASLLGNATLVLSRELVVVPTGEELALAHNLAVFEGWMKAHRRVYDSEVEKMNRFQIFNDNLEKIKKHNQVEGQTFDKGLNGFSDMTFTEFRAKYLGLLPLNTTEMEDLEAWEVSQKTMHIPVIGDDTNNLPKRWNWLHNGGVTPAKNQDDVQGKSCRACWAFGSVAAIEGLHYRQTGQLLNLSEQQLIDCDVYNEGCYGGFPHKAYYYLSKSRGLWTSEAYGPYKAEKGNCMTMDFAPAVHIMGFRFILTFKEEDIKVAVHRQPLTVAIHVTEEFLQYNDTSPVYRGKECGSVGSKMLDHVLTLVGYGENDEEGEYWILKNSWGTDWGELGFIRIARGHGVPREGVCGLYHYVTYPFIRSEL